MQPEVLQAELVEGLDDVVERAEVVEVVAVDVQNDAERGVQLQEGVDIFAGLADHGVALADAAVAADEGQLAADDGARVAARLDQDLREHAGRGRLAVRAGDGDGVRKLLREQAEHHRALERRDALFARGDKLRVILLCGGGVDDELRVADVLGAVAHADRDAVAADALERVGFVDVAAGDHIALMVEDLRHRAHARAADAHKVQAFDCIQ